MQRISNLTRSILAVCVSLGATSINALHAREYPSRSIRIIVPFSPGGAVDGPTRIVAQELSKRLNQQVVVENKPGAGATKLRALAVT